MVSGFGTVLVCVVWRVWKLGGSKCASIWSWFVVCSLISRTLLEVDFNLNSRSLLYAYTYSSVK